MTRTYKIGLNKGRPRIWIDGKLLLDAGFHGGDSYTCVVRPGRIQLIADNYSGGGLSDAQVTRRRVTGRLEGKPIVDLLGRDVEAAFPGAARVLVTFGHGTVSIVVDSDHGSGEK